jgi:hypothetical protein
MSRRRVAALLAIMAALAGAPSSVSAAQPNQLSQASVTPLSGDTSTLFVVMVRYRSTAGHPASVVSVNAGGQVTALTLVSGTTTDGIWSGADTLPPGHWEITFEASVATGSEPSLLAGTVSVTGATAPTTTGGNAPSSATGPAGEGNGASSAPAPQPAATAAPTGGVTPAPAMRSTEAAPSQPPTGPARGLAAAAGPGRGAEAPARPPRADRAGGSATQLSASASPSGARATAPGRDPGDLGILMLIGTLAFGAVALVGSAWLLVAAQRDRRAAAEPGVDTAAIVDQRARRRARLRSTDDPILAAMGLPDEDATAGAASAAPASSPRNRGRRRAPKR